MAQFLTGRGQGGPPPRSFPCHAAPALQGACKSKGIRGVLSDRFLTGGVVVVYTKLDDEEGEADDGDQES